MVTLASHTDWLLTLAQSEGDAGAAIFGLGFMCCFMIFGLAAFGFWLWMLIDCCTRTFPGESDKIMWILIIALLGVIGAAVYYFVGRPKGTKS